MTDNVIVAESLSKEYSSGKVALRDVSFEIPRGSLTAVIGRNGAGKTTLLKCVAGLVGFELGEVSILLGKNELIALRPGSFEIARKDRKRIGVVFQDMGLWPHLTILDNVIDPLIDIHGLTRDQAVARAEDWLLRRFNLNDVDLGRYPQELSVGIQRRVAIARTLVTNPDILLIDEMEANLDPEAVENVLRIIRDDFIDDQTKTVLMITHRVDFLRSYASKVVILDEGRVIGVGSPRSVLDSSGKSPELDGFIKNVIDPSTSHWNFGYKCLESSINITSLSLMLEDSLFSVLQQLSMEVLTLLTKLEPDPHLVMIVTRDIGSPKKLALRGICKSDDFLLNGGNVRALGPLVDASKEDFAEEYQEMLDRPGGSMFDTGRGLSGSLIALMFKDELKSSYVFADTFDPVQGPQHIAIPPKEGSVEKLAYYEFSRATRNVYLFPMEWHGKVVGVLSIDTCSEKKWFPFIIEQLLLIANLGATAIQVDKGSRGSI